VLVSAAFADALADAVRLISLGHHDLRGVREPREIYGVLAGATG
jgi:class 3 adenylate cyclase